VKPGDAASLVRYLLKRAPQYQLDPNAVVAVAVQEGLSGKVGDNGTSFGPWQLHQGGAYPSSAPQSPDAANAWAWSPAGIDYALGRMQSVAGGLKGRQAVRAIVYRFERPSDPAAEYKNAVAALPANDGGPKGGGGIGAILGGANAAATGVVPGLGAAEGVAGAAGGVVHGVEATASFLGKLTDPHFWLQALEVVGGGLFVLFGLYLLGRQTGVVQRAQGAALMVASVTPPGRAAKVAGAAGAVEGASMKRATQAKAARRAALDRRYGTEAPF
jgi:hypothetical protein